MIVIHQAIYGENGGHALLKASVPQTGIADRVSGYTDLNDRPVGGVLENAVVRGLFIENHFLFIKTFPDLTPNMRRGRVFSHVLILDRSSFLKTNNICDLFQYFLHEIDKNGKMEPINFPNLSTAPHSLTIDKREAASINSILKHEDYNNCIVWIGEKGYWECISRIWKQLPNASKMDLKIGAAFNPQNAKEENFNLIYIPNDYKSNWTRSSCKIIDVNESEELNSSALWLLGGNSNNTLLVNDLIQDFEPTINTISDLTRLQDIGKVYQQINQKPPLSELLVLSDFISRVVPTSSLGQKGKENLLNAIVKTIPTTSIQIFSALMYQNWKGFNNANDILNNPLIAWLESNLFYYTNSNEIGQMLLSVVSAEKGNWWAKVIRDFLCEKFKMWQNHYTRTVWQWMITNPQLIQLHNNWLPEHVEFELSEGVPKLKEHISKGILVLSKEKKWFLLHGMVISKLYEPNVAISEQLLIDSEQISVAPLEAIAKNITAKDFVDVTVSLSDARLFKISGKLIQRQPELMEGMKIEEQGWQYIWEETIKNGQPVWTGIKECQKLLFRIMDRIVAGKNFNIYLLERIGKSEIASLKEYPNRIKVWQYLPSNCKHDFIYATALDCIGDIANGKLTLNDFEQELIHSFQSYQMMKTIIEMPTLLVRSKIRLFGIFPKFDESLTQIFIGGNNFNKEDAEELGMLAQKRNWKSIATYLYNNYERRSDLLFALTACIKLLGPLQRFDLFLKNVVKKDTMTKEDLDNLLLQKACELYPEGPMKNGIWEIAGGEKSDLHQNGTGKSIWSNGLSHIKAGGKPKIQDLIDAMLKEFPYDVTLKNLKQNL